MATQSTIEDPIARQSGRPLLGIGSCLAGNAVRYNGSSNKSNAHVRKLCEHFDTRAFCPEMAIGLDTPRPPIHLVGSPGAVRVLDVATHRHDYTDPIAAYAAEVMADNRDLCGYILVQDSPSCGLQRVKRYSTQGRLQGYDQDGIFAAALKAANPLLPLEDDGRLTDAGRRESFATRVWAYHEWHTLNAAGLNASTLINFYRRYKYLVMAHHVPSYRAIGEMLANAGNEDIDALATQVIAKLMQALARPATRRSHSNVLFYLAAYLKRSIAGEQHRALTDRIEQYRSGQAPLIVPLTLLRLHHANNLDVYIDQQAFYGRLS